MFKQRKCICVSRFGAIAVHGELLVSLRAVSLLASSCELVGEVSCGVFPHGCQNNPRQESNCPCARSLQCGLYSEGTDVVQMLVAFVVGFGLPRVVVTITVEACRVLRGTRFIVDRFDEVAAEELC